MAQQRRLTELDVFRGIAACLVLLHHFVYIFHDHAEPVYFFNYGITGVEFFFMISGFVIVMSLNNVKTLKDFWISRALRLYPAYWTSIVIALVSAYIFGEVQPAFTGRMLWGNVLMLQPIFRTYYMVGVYWTLYIELNFYLAMSLLWAINKLRQLERIVLAGLVIMFVFNLLFVLLPPTPATNRFFIGVRTYFPLIGHFNMFAAGIVFYIIYKEGFNTKRILLLVACYLLTLLQHSLTGTIHYVIGLTEHMLCNLVYFVLFVLLVSDKLSFINKKWLIFLGTASYSIYLIHYTFGIYLTRYLLTKVHNGVSIIVGVLATIFLAALVTHFVEKPALKLKKWFFAAK